MDLDKIKAALAAPAIAALVEEVDRLRATVDAVQFDALIANYKSTRDAISAELDKTKAALAEAKRLGLEACDLADEATGSASEAPDCGEQVADYRKRCAAIRAALEDL